MTVRIRGHTVGFAFYPGEDHAMRQIQFSGLSTLLIVLSCTFIAPESHAEIREDGAPTSSLGMADAVRANATGATALYFNPAGMSLLRQYAIEAGYNFANALDGHTFNTSIVDSKTNGALGMGFGYAYVSSVLSGKDRDGHTMRGALSTGYRGKGFSIYIGASVRYAELAKGEADTEENGLSDDTKFITMDAGLIATLGQYFSLGVVGRNLIDAKALHEAPRSVAFGIAGSYKGFRVSADLDLDIQTNEDEKPIVGYAIGAQYLIRGMILLRAGFTGAGVSGENKLAFGAAYISKTMGVDVGVRHNLDRSVDTHFGLSVKFFLP